MHGIRGGTPSGTSPTESHTGDENKRWSQIVKKYTANGLVRRGRPLTSQTAFGGQLPYKGSLVQSAVRFHHSPSEYNDRLFTNHEPRATIFSTSRGSHKANGGLRTATGEAVGPKFR